MRLVPVCVLATALAACSGDRVLAPPLGFSHAIARFSCGPTDGPVVQIILSRTPWPATPVQQERASPYVVINIYELASPQEGSWAVGPNQSTGSAALYRGGVDYEMASGVVRVSRVAADNRAQGSVSLFVPSLGQLRGGFEAVWMPPPPPPWCG